jgi:phosphoenolpyruvate-protein phosphotransferase (PTS system enzyme I)
VTEARRLDRLGGVGASPGVAAGPVALLAGRVPEPPAGGAAGSSAAEAGAALDALEAVAADLDARGEAAGGDAQDVLEAEAMMARDPSLATRIEELAGGGLPAARAVWEAFAAYRERLAAAGGYLAARAADLDDVRDRAVARLLGVPMPGVPDPGHPFVLVAVDLAPADTVTLRRDRVLGFVTEQGGPTSHTAILARAMGVPAVVGCAGAAGLADGTVVVVDGASGEVLVDPDQTAVQAAQAKAAARADARRSAATDRRPGATADGHRVDLLANLGGPAEAAAAAAAGAEGVGLLRTEFLYLDRASPPSVEEQRAAYAAVLDAFPGGKVVVRTLDAGADKPLAFLGLPGEPNPALGVRGLRALRRAPKVLADQLEAIGQAAAASSTEVWVMAPMVALPAEAAWFREQASRQPVAKAGVMIEVPAAALAAQAILAAAEFASIGTNDLAQYTFAADRQAGDLAALQDPWQPVLLDLVGRVGEAGRGAGRPVGVCGEAAGDPVLALVLVGLGATSLSMAPASLADVRVLLSRHTLVECRTLAHLALAAPDADAARSAVSSAVRGLDELGL